MVISAKEGWYGGAVTTRVALLELFLGLTNTIFLTFATLTAFVCSVVSIPKAFTKIIHPIFTSTTMIWIILKIKSMLLFSLFSLLSSSSSSNPSLLSSTSCSFLDELLKYKASPKNPSLKFGAGDILLNLLGPIVVSFSMAIYARRKLLWENLFVVLSGSTASALGTLYGTAAFVNLINLGGGDNSSGSSNGSSYGLLRLSTLARNVVAPLAVVICKTLGGNSSIQLSIVVLTGVLCATFASRALDFVGIRNPVSRGMGVGACGLSLGAASLLPDHPDEFPFAVLSFVFNAVIATIAVSAFPSIRESLTNLAIGTGGGVA